MFFFLPCVICMMGFTSLPCKLYLIQNTGWAECEVKDRITVPEGKSHMLSLWVRFTTSPPRNNKYTADYFGLSLYDVILKKNTASRDSMVHGHSCRRHLDRWTSVSFVKRVLWSRRHSSTESFIIIFIKVLCLLLAVHRHS